MLSSGPDPPSPNPWFGAPPNPEISRFYAFPKVFKLFYVFFMLLLNVFMLFEQKYSKTLVKA